MKALVFVCIVFSTALASAEYRVFKLKITNSKTKVSRFVYSTLDWIQYHEYNYLKPEEVVRLADTWMCWKRHQAFKPLCQRPVNPATLKADSEDAES